MNSKTKTLYILRQSISKYTFIATFLYRIHMKRFLVHFFPTLSLFSRMLHSHAQFHAKQHTHTHRHTKNNKMNNRNHFQKDKEEHKLCVIVFLVQCDLFLLVLLLSCSCLKFNLSIVCLLVYFFFLNLFYSAFHSILLEIVFLLHNEKKDTKRTIEINSSHEIGRMFFFFRIDASLSKVSVKNVWMEHSKFFFSI